MWYFDAIWISQTRKNDATHLAPPKPLHHAIQARKPRHLHPRPHQPPAHKLQRRGDVRPRPHRRPEDGDAVVDERQRVEAHEICRWRDPDADDGAEGG